MRLAVSNIAWPAEDEAAALNVLRTRGAAGIEVAPTMLWPDWAGATVAAAEAERRRYADAGFEVPALQAIVYGKPGLRVFDAGSHAALLEHMKMVSDLGAALGASVLVLGAPKNRLRGQLGMADAMDRAVALMREVGEVCQARGVRIGWEHNPVEYGCDFVTNVADARSLVDRVDHPGVGLHLDTGGLWLCGGDPLAPIEIYPPYVHAHLSAPMLEPLAGSAVDCAAVASALGRTGYDGWLSIEMRSAGLDALESAVVGAMEALA